MAVEDILVDARADSSDNENPSANSNTDEQTSEGISGKRRRYHRHTQYQIEEMESFFKKCAHPNGKQRKELSRDLGLDPLQVKFWFQNKRTHLKAQLERKDNVQLRAENEKLKIEKNKLKQSMSSSSRNKCGNPCTNEKPSEEQRLVMENARLVQEIERLTDMVKFPLSNISKSSIISLSLNQCSLQFGRQPENFRSGNILGWNKSCRPPNCLSEQDIAFLIQRAISAAEEIAVMAQVGEPLWIWDIHRNKLVLNQEEYLKIFQKGFATKSVGLISEASRECAYVIMSHLNVVELFMELNKWVGVFSGIISKAKLHKVIAAGAAGSYNGAMQVISAQFRTLSLVVPTRLCDFIRYCKQLNDETWVIVDVSMDCLISGDPMSRCQKRPSGCFIQAMPNGSSKIIWVEHVEVVDQIIHNLSQSIINSGYAYGAKRWTAILKRQCERLACARGITNHPYVGDLNNIELTHLEGKQSVLRLAERMVLNFYSGVTSTSSAYYWTTVLGNGIDEVRIMTRKTVNEPGRPDGVMLNASICFWIPVLPKIVFDYLRNGKNRVEWDILSNGGVVQEIAHIGNGQETGNCISLLQITHPNEDQRNMLILQESSTEPTTSFIVYAPVDLSSIGMLFGGGDPENIPLLPSGFTILPSGPPCFNGGVDDSIVANGTLLSISFQILVDSDPFAKLHVSSVSTVSKLVESTSKKIKFALGVLNLSSN